MRKMIPVIVVAVLALDQATKFLASHLLTLAQSVPLIKGVFHITLVHNRGAAFGILKNQTPFFIFASLLAILLIIAHLKSARQQKREGVALGLILAGALGNLIDRISLGYVIDFLDFRVWPVFNLADSAITIGAILLGWSILKPGAKKDAS